MEEIYFLKLARFCLVLKTSPYRCKMKQSLIVETLMLFYRENVNAFIVVDPREKQV